MMCIRSIPAFCLLALSLTVAGDWIALPAAAQTPANGQEAAPGGGGRGGPEGRGRGMRRQRSNGRGPMARRREQRQQMMQLRIVDRLSRMSSAERERLLDALPPPRRRMVERNLRRFQEMPPERRAALVERLRQFDQMTPERQTHLRELLRSMAQLPQDRRRELQSEFTRLKRMPDEDRLDYLASSAFREKFSETERDLLLDLVDTAPAP